MTQYRPSWNGLATERTLEDIALVLSSPVQVSIESTNSDSYALTDVVDSTNIAAGTVYYPSATGMSMDGYKDMSISGQLIDASTVTLTVEVSQDEDTSHANFVQAYAYDIKGNLMVNSFATVNGTFAWDFDNLNCNVFRIKVVYGSSTNTAIIKMRRKA